MDSEFRNEILCRSMHESLRSQLTRVSLVAGQVVYEVDAPITDVYFVEDGIISVTANTSDNGQVEVGLIGREGLSGTSLLLNEEPYSIHRVFTQIPGYGYRMTATQFLAAIERSDSLRSHCLRYIDFAFAQTAQVAACNARHTLHERLARWLLMVRDRMRTDSFALTQEFLAMMLGVRRAGVSVASSVLQADNLIRVARGNVTLLDIPGLIDASCDCYQVIQRNKLRLLGYSL